ncbi:MAG: hypothetical protein H3C62_07010 [Gemmatimonadaceae bacterium]|nr:hypothetical protein [Gemmatimonadaceae bacterium]
MHLSLRRLFTLALVLFGTMAGGADAQGRPALSITLPSTEQVARSGPVVVASHMLGGGKLRELLASGFPARLHFTVELWSVGGWTNDLERLIEWDVVVRRLAVEETYEVVQVIGDRPFSLGKFAQLTDAEAAVARPTRAPIVAAPEAGRFYYQATLTVETLSLSDLDEVERWLRGELRPAVRGQRNPGSVLGRGLKTLATRLLGGEKREYVARTSVFRTSPATK